MSCSLNVLFFSFVYRLISCLRFSKRGQIYTGMLCDSGLVFVSLPPVAAAAETTGSRVRSAPPQLPANKQAAGAQRQVGRQASSLLSPASGAGKGLRTTLSCPPPPPTAPPPPFCNQLTEAGMQNRISPPPQQPRKSKHCLSAPSPIVIHRGDKYLIPSKDTFC